MGEHHHLDVGPADDHDHRGALLINHHYDSAVSAAEFLHHAGHDHDYSVLNLHHRFHHYPREHHDHDMAYNHDDYDAAGDHHYDGICHNHHDGTGYDNYHGTSDYYDDSASHHYYDDPGIYDHYVCAGLDHHNLDAGLHDDHRAAASDDCPGLYDDGPQGDHDDHRAPGDDNHHRSVTDDNRPSGDDDNHGGSGRRAPGAEQYATLGGHRSLGLHGLRCDPVGGGWVPGHPHRPRPVRILSLGQAASEVSTMTFLGCNPAELYRYFLKAFRGQWIEVSKGEWVSAERAAGLTNYIKPPTEPGSTAFSNGAVQGIIITNGVTVPSDFDWAPEFRDFVWPTESQ